MGGDVTGASIHARLQDDGEWAPTFPNARYTYIKDEFDYHRELAEGAKTTNDLSHAVVYAGADPDIRLGAGVDRSGVRSVSARAAAQARWQRRG